MDFYCFPPTSKSILSAVSCPSYSLYKRLRRGWRRWSSLWIRRERRDGRGAGGPAAEYLDSLPFASCCRPGSGSRGEDTSASGTEIQVKRAASASNLLPLCVLPYAFIPPAPPGRSAAGDSLEAGAAAAGPRQSWQGRAAARSGRV